jgi:hypothetical protein
MATATERENRVFGQYERSLDGQYVLINLNGLLHLTEDQTRDVFHDMEVKLMTGSVDVSTAVLAHILKEHSF